MVSISTLEKLDYRLPADLTAKVKDCQEKLKVLPAAASQALELMNDSDCSIGAVARTIEQDVTMASGVLAMANSAIYSPGYPVAVVRDAIVHVGFHKCRNLIHSICAASLVNKVAASDDTVSVALARHSLLTAAIASELNRHLGLGYDGEEFTAGLLHDVGRLMFCVMNSDELTSEQRHQLMTSDDVVVEQALLRADHCTVGCFFAIANRFPPSIAEATRFHHNPEASSIDPRLTSMIAIADDLAEYLVQEDSPYDWQDNPGLDVFGAITGQATVAHLQQDLNAILKQAVDNMATLALPKAR